MADAAENVVPLHGDQSEAPAPSSGVGPRQPDSTREGSGSVRGWAVDQAARFYQESLSRVRRGRGAARLAEALGIGDTITGAWGKAASGKPLPVWALLAAAEAEPEWAQAMADKLGGSIDSAVHRRPRPTPHSLVDDAIALLDRLGVFGVAARDSETDGRIDAGEYERCRRILDDFSAALRRASDNLEARYQQSQRGGR